jgi:type I pantothenate kinase
VPQESHERLAAEVAARSQGLRRPALVGISGGVGAGKSTLAGELRDVLRAAGARVEVLGTDSFLLPNEQLAARGLLMRKGFPESFDTGLMLRSLRAVRAGELPLAVPVYCHSTYDRVPGEEQAIPPADTVLLEGVNALQEPAARLLDLAVYIDVPEPVMRAWYVERFLRYCEEAERDTGSFYRAFAGLTVAERAYAAEQVWEQVNLPNLVEHILPSRDRATLVVEKDRDHKMTALWRK